jgi:hypothetical protein
MVSRDGRLIGAIIPSVLRATFHAAGHGTLTGRIMTRPSNMSRDEQATFHLAKKTFAGNAVIIPNNP